MDVAAGSSWAGRVGVAVGHMAKDRIDDAFGRALPTTPEQLARPAVVETLLRQYPPRGSDPPIVPIADVRLPGIEFDSSNCQNFLVDVAWEASADPAHVASTTELPGRLYAKLPCRELGTRVFANAVGFWSVEATFCRHLATRVPIRVPRVHAVAERGARFVLLLEDLGADPSVVLFQNRDMAAGTTPERAARCLRTFAELHAAFWETPPGERDSVLPIRLHPYLSPGGRGRSRALASIAIAPARRAAPDLFEDRHEAMLREAVEKWDRLVDVWYREPLTLVHGDSHLANCFEYAGSDGPRIGMLDFQGTHWCPGVRDVQYFLANSVEPKLLAAQEDDLLASYLDALAAHGVSLDRARAREQYVASSLQTLLVAVTTIGLGSLTERSETLRTVLRRNLAAVDRLGFADWLANL